MPFLLSKLEQAGCRNLLRGIRPRNRSSGYPAAPARIGAKSLGVRRTKSSAFINFTSLAGTAENASHPILLQPLRDNEKHGSARRTAGPVLGLIQLLRR